LVFTAFLRQVQHEDKPASSLVVFYGKTLNEIASTFCVVQLVETGRNINMTRRPKMTLRCLLVEVPWQKN